MKKLIFAFVTVLMVLVLSCEPNAASSSSGTSDEAKDVLKICVIHNNADHPSIAAIVQGMDDEGKIYNAEITYFDPVFDPQRQASMIEDSIARRPDVIVVNCVDPVAVIPAIRRAYENNIPVITHNANVGAEGLQYIQGYVGTQGYNQGYAVGKMMVSNFGSRQIKVVVIGGRAGQTDAIARVEGMQDAWSDAGMNYTIISDQPADWSKDRALTIMQDLLTRFPDGSIDAVFACDDPMALGAVEAIRAAGRKNIAVYGVNGNLDAFTAIRAGDMKGTALQMSYLVGVYTVRAAYDVKMKRIIPDITMAPTAPITIDNIDEWQRFAW